MPTARGTSSVVSGRQGRVETVAEISRSRHPPVAKRLLVQSRVWIPIETRDLAFLPKTARAFVEYSVNNVCPSTEQHHVRSPPLAPLNRCSDRLGHLQFSYLIAITGLVPRIADFANHPSKALSRSELFVISVPLRNPDCDAGRSQLCLTRRSLSSLIMESLSKSIPLSATEECCISTRRRDALARVV